MSHCTNPLELNYSKIMAYKKCPFLYSYIYLGKKYTPYSAKSSLGVSVHRALARYARYGGDLSDLFVYYDESWNNSGFASPQESMEFYNKGSRMLEDFWLDNQDKKSRIIFSERTFEFKFEKWTVKGTIDRLDKNADGAYELIDYKIGFEEMPDFDPLKNLQLGIYAVGLKENFNIDVNYLTCWFLMRSERVTAAYDKSLSSFVFDEIRNIGEKIINEDYSSKGDCQKCSIKKLCRHAEIENRNQIADSSEQK
ncbi:MAG: PD-(D/E)XK nuclease family protein [Elusimicrobiales bacterium]|nr:PD-(D/E)XK nuclease family protein [Elusimicrobiales bacterium]